MQTGGVGGRITDLSAKTIADGGLNKAAEQEHLERGRVSWRRVRRKLTDLSAEKIVDGRLNKAEEKEHLERELKGPAHVRQD